MTESIKPSAASPLNLRRKQEIAAQYLNSPRVPKSDRDDYQTELSNSTGNVWLSRGICALTVTGGLIASFITASDANRAEAILLNTPAEITDLGQRYWANPGTGLSLEQAALYNSVRDVLNEILPNERKAIIFSVPPKGNDVGIMNATRDTITISPAALAVAFRKNIEQEQALLERTSDTTRNLSVMFSGLALLWVLNAGMARHRTLQTALDHYGIK